MKARAQIRDFIEHIEKDQIWPSIGQLRDLERAIIDLDSRLFAHMTNSPHDCEASISGELAATKRHLEDMRRLVLLENKDGDV